MEIVDETKGHTAHFPLSHMKTLLDSDVEHITTLSAALNTHHRQAENKLVRDCTESDRRNTGL